MKEKIKTILKNTNKKTLGLIAGIVVIIFIAFIYFNRLETYEETVNGISFKMIAVDGGTFYMGAQSENSERINYDPEAKENESPVHKVTLSSYYISETEVTQELWEAVMGTNIEEQQKRSKRKDDYRKGPKLPMYFVSWIEAKEFCEKLSELTGKEYCLPTEAQWEFAARGGNKSEGYLYSGTNDIYSLTQGFSYCDTVKSTLPNELGIYNMSGNVKEWCNDFFIKYTSESEKNPTYSRNEVFHSDSMAVRGGGSLTYYYAYRIPYRSFCWAGWRHENIGFRIAHCP